MTSQTQNDSDYRRAVPTSLYPPVRGMGRYYGDSDGDTTRSQVGLGIEAMAQSVADRLTEANRLVNQGLIDRLANLDAQVEGIPAQNLQNVVFDLDLREVLGYDNIRMLHTVGLPESLMLDIYMSWRTMTKRPPETDADFVQYNAFVHDQLELIYDGMTAADGPEDIAAVLDMTKHLDDIVPNVVNLSWMVGSRAEQEIGPVLATMPNHEFVMDSVRDLPGNSIGMTVTDDPRMADVEGDPKEMGPVGYFVKLGEDGKPINYSIASPEEMTRGTTTHHAILPVTIANAKPGLYMTGIVDTAVIPHTAAQQVDWTQIHEIPCTVPPAQLDPPMVVNDFQKYFQK